MKKVIQCLSFLLLLFLLACSEKETNDSLSTPWKFQTGDDLNRAKPEFNDSLWPLISPMKIWEQQGFKNYNGIAWYRKHVFISSSLKKNIQPGDSIQLYLGKIDDCDQVFLNGLMIGENNTYVPNGKAADSSFIKGRDIWFVQRRYLLDVNDPRIHWDQDNLIAVRCYDHGGDGGMFDNRYELSVTGLRDRVTINTDKNPYIISDSSITKTIILENCSKTIEYHGDLVIKIIESQYESFLCNEKTGILLTPGAKLEKTISCRRISSLPAKMIIEFKDAKSQQVIYSETVIPYILTPKEHPAPKINSASVFGVRPYSSFIFKVAASGVKPMKYSAEGLPQGLVINPENGLITGMLKKKGDYMVNLSVENEKGSDSKAFKIICGDIISLTPPLGWNSWNCWGLSVSDAKVRESSSYMVSSGLIDHGWSYINIDDGWQASHDKNGDIIPNYKFPDMTSLCDYIHSLGLKAGIYSSPGPKTCGGYEGSYKFEEQDALNYAKWGIDYLKYDWCSYFSIAPNPSGEQLKKPYKEMRHALRKTNRDIHYSLCQYGMGEVWKWGHEVDGNSWRTTGDITDTWESMSGIGFDQNQCSDYATSGRWNDPDMLVVGWVGWGPDLHYTKLTPDEQYTHISLWSLLASPLLIGCDLSKLDAFTLNLLTNDEVLAVNQDALGQQAKRIYRCEEYEIWSKDLSDGSKALGLFNKSEKCINIPVDLTLLCIEGKWTLRDLWRQTDLGSVRHHFEMRTPSHGVRLIKLCPAEPAKK